MSFSGNYLISMKGMINWFVAILGVWALDYFVMGSVNPYYYSVLMYAGVNIILATSLNLVNGFTGQFSMGHAGFMAVGAYFAAGWTTYLQGAHPGLLMGPFGFFIFIGILFFGGLLTAGIGYVVGLPSLRLQGDYLAIVTLGFGEIIRVILLNIDALGGARGIPAIPRLTNFGLLYSFVILSVFAVWRLLKSAHGRAFLSVREDEIAAESMGVNTTKTKVRAFVFSSFLAGIAGGLFAHVLQYISPATFDMNRSFEIIIMVVMGGMGSVTGSVVAAGFLTLIREQLRELQNITMIDLRMVIYSLMLIVLMLTRPNGLFGSSEWVDFWARMRGKNSGKSATQGDS